MLDIQMQAATEKYIREIKETEIYKQYSHQLGKIKQDPALFEKVNEYRFRNFEIQNSSQGQELFEKMDAFEKEYEKFREDPVVDDFLCAELAFCRLMQEANAYITEALDFE